ncbi:MAG: hypothetical protein BGP24_11255 [Lysobacterales bacterium 69-70]|nr:DUF4124 domain-containing protein [Xanthomonadaceae bacterium]ODU30800.1 MAG: hypothetical protein ABS97_21025 [Xanthomonadaceae bacterium SCN 69-320]ODV22127.1 MAG: hypothetical protein ABT27_02400 [Xanthomonadaceae bacterium SCN 69-25]OJY98388.1 MAG: hypothetical protein BGP24_11255 [Xanthomonadales bacterium 69-70]
MKAIQVAFGLLAAVAATAGHSADKVYKWKDAAGVVHFSDAPPPKGTEFDNVRIVNQSAAITQEQTQAAAPAAAAGEAKPAAQNVAQTNEERCRLARERVALLNSPSTLTVERNGKNVDMTAAERAAELRIATTTVESLCTPPAGGP